MPSRNFPELTIDPAAPDHVFDPEPLFLWKPMLRTPSALAWARFSRLA